MKKINQLHCFRCSYDWNSKKEKPKTCPRCKSYFWYKLTKEQEQKEQFDCEHSVYTADVKQNKDGSYNIGKMKRH